MIPDPAHCGRMLHHEKAERPDRVHELPIASTLQPVPRWDNRGPWQGRFRKQTRVHFLKVGGDPADNPILRRYTVSDPRSVGRPVSGPRSVGRPPFSGGSKWAVSSRFQVGGFQVVPSWAPPFDFLSWFQVGGFQAVPSWPIFSAGSKLRFSAGSKLGASYKKGAPSPMNDEAHADPHPRC